MNNNAPKIRFKGFTDAWVQRKLGEVAEFSKGSGYSKGDLTELGSPIILYGRLYTNYETVINDVDTFVDMRDNSVISQGNEVIVPSSGETAEDIARASVVEKPGIIFGGDLNIVKPISTINPTFLAITISNGNQQKELRKKAQGKSIVHLHNSDLKNVVLQLPDIPEQTAIGSFFRTLDDTITLHKRKLDGLKELKKGYLQQMFPQNEETVPRVRFKGFEGEWESKRIGDIFEVTRGQVLAATTVSQAKTDKFFYPVYSSQTKNDGLMGYYTDYLFDTAITWTTDGANAGTVSFRKSKFYSTNVNGVLLSTDGYANPCVAEALNRIAYKYVSRVGNPKLMNNIMSEIVIALPTIKEQTAIGNFFHNLDEQIATQATKLEQLRRLKAAYLQKMFI